MKYYRVALLLFFSMTLLSSTALAKNNIKPFVGLWTVAFEQTINEVKKSPKYKAKDAERMPSMVKRLMGKMKIKISENQFVYIRGSKEHAFDIEFSDANKDSATATTVINGKKYTLTFNLIDGKYMNFKSSASDDMDFYIWETK